MPPRRKSPICTIPQTSWPAHHYLLYVYIPVYEGIRPITSLWIFSIGLHANEDELKKTPIVRGCKVQDLAGSHYDASHGNTGSLRHDWPTNLDNMDDLHKQ